MIQNWLDKPIESNNYTFRVCRIGEINTPSPAVIEYLQKEILKSYRTLDFYKYQFENVSEEEIKKYILNNVIPSDKSQPDKNVRQGDWGEVLASLIVSYFQNLEIPMSKLLWKVNRSKSVFGTDLIAFDKDDNKKLIYYYEIKARVSPQKKEGTGPDRNYITILAHNSLLEDVTSPQESIGDFFNRLFYEQGQYDKARKFKDLTLNPNSYTRNYELFFIVEEANFTEIVLQELNSLPPILDPLKVSVILIKNLKDIIDNTWMNIENSIIEILKESSVTI